MCPGWRGPPRHAASARAFTAKRIFGWWTGEIDSCFLEELRCFKSVVYHARTPYINKVSIEGWLQAKSFQSDIPNMSTDPGPKRLLKKSLWLRRKRPTSPRPYFFVANSMKNPTLLNHC